MNVTQDEFKNALCVVDEGKEAHGLYAVEDAMSVVKSVARYYWRQMIFGMMSTAISFLVVWKASIQLPWFYFAVLALGIIFALIGFNTPLNRLFAPKGFTAEDVRTAYFQSIRAV